MSIGYCARARKSIEDENVIVYEYNCYNLEFNNWREAMQNWDGFLWIDKTSLVEPEIHIKRKKYKKKRIIVKRVEKEVDLLELLENKKIEIVNCRNAWHKCGEYDLMALRLLRRIFSSYQKLGKLPEKEYYYV